MLIFNRHAELSDHLASVSANGANVGFVPTMGALHAGHLSLLQQSVEQNQLTVISIFVNPTQFNNPEDLEKYPRTLERDLEMISSVDQNIIVFTPSTEDIYGQRAVSNHYDFDGLENQMEGKFRPGHFDGVGTIVHRLLEIVKPTSAYFGEKDFQQLQIVRKLAQKYSPDVTIIGCPIYREASGLAMSSRNERLTASERSRAAVIFETLAAAKIKFQTQSPAEVSQYVEQVFANTADFDLEYFTIAEEATLLPIASKVEGVDYRAFIAVIVNKIRLIDTVSLN